MAQRSLFLRNLLNRFDLCAVQEELISTAKHAGKTMFAAESSAPRFVGNKDERSEEKDSRGLPAESF